mmetsp:Transcript_72904/g.207696  ORF Transcript_72904/g.207696 Transcript_72904/m.207696 type:complete len:242 (+) Transcript_72904:746-1471(+)
MPHILEILPRGCSKGRGVEELLMHLEIDEESCIAFGDAENDIEMLEFVGTGFSVANALPSVTDAADASTLSNDDDGVAAVLAKVVKAEPTFSDSGAVSDGFGLELALGLAEKGGLVSGDGVDINQLVLDEAAAQEELKEALELLELQKVRARFMLVGLSVNPSLAPTTSQPSRSPALIVTAEPRGGAGLRQRGGASAGDGGDRAARRGARSVPVTDRGRGRRERRGGVRELEMGGGLRAVL